MKKFGLIAVLLSISMFAACLTGCGAEPEEPPIDKYLASDCSTVVYYTQNEEGAYEAAGVMTRGTCVTLKAKPIVLEEEETTYYAYVVDEETTYYFNEKDLEDTKDACVRETEKFVRTPATTYKEKDTPDIAGFVKKGTRLEITGFDAIKDDGEIDIYQVKDEAGNEGWVFSKYLVDSEEGALAVNEEYYNLNKDKIYDPEFDLYGGSPTKLDYFPYDKSFETDNVMPEECKTLYLNAGCIDYMDSYIECAKDIGANAFVIDIKDGNLAYHAEVAKEYTPTSYEDSFHDNDQYKAAIDKANEAGIWTIGRIVVFNDSQFAQDNPEECIYNNGINQEWPSAYSRRAWEYNVKLAISAVEEMGFDEIEFDYVRFPENAYSLSSDGTADFKNTYEEEKSEAIQNFCFYATDQLHKAGAYFSVDVFGECSDGYVTAYGQYWPAISNIVDAISSMPYIDHFGREVYTWVDGYGTVYNWAAKAAEAQKITPTPAAPRTWLTCYAVPYWDPEIPVTGPFLQNQAQALWDAGVGSGGFITWNAASNLDIYYNVADAFSHAYSAEAVAADDGSDVSGEEEYYEEEYYEEEYYED